MIAKVHAPAVNLEAQEAHQYDRKVIARLLAYIRPVLAEGAGRIRYDDGLFGHRGRHTRPCQIRNRRQRRNR